MKRAPLIFSILIIFALGLAGCAGPSQAAYNEALEKLGAANLRNENLQKQVDFLEDATAQLQQDLLQSESRLSAEISAREQLENLQTAGLCPQSWELATNETLIFADSSDNFLTPAAISVGYMMLSTQYLTVADTEGNVGFVDGVPFYFLLINPDLFPGIFIDITQGCVIVPPAAR